jgi:2-polyprenyl-6-hydroxyphenyl methylase/3-demethylubiquinone-9 3-methyltransferase
VLELGCGYGRVALRLAGRGGRVTGIDLSAESVEMARTLAAGATDVAFRVMDASMLDFPNASYDRTVCVQNGIRAFRVDPAGLVREAVRVTRPGGRAIFSSYAEAFWPHRLRWFEIQADLGLVGPIDRAATRDGVIACTDGFRSGTMTPAGFEALCREAGLRFTIEEVDRSSVFCEIEVS